MKFFWTRRRRELERELVVSRAELERVVRERDNVIRSLSMFLTQLQTVADDRDRFAELYERAYDALLVAEREREYWKARAAFPTFPRPRSD